ncbi:MAG: hypothetical protein GC168_05415 [Candidatus Hydrogenedens sp.]|nr:hypothetical protein [Candidatus Hydrogenedens sp.]
MYPPTRGGVRTAVFGAAGRFELPGETTFRPLLATAWALAGLSLAMFFAAVYSYQSLRGDFELIQRSRDFDGLRYQLFSLLKDAETGQRGFLLTHDPQYLAPYEAALAGIPVLLDRLSWAETSPDKERLAIEMRAALTAKLDEVEHVLKLDAASPESAMSHLRTGRGKRLMDRLRTIFEQMETLQADTMARLYARNARDARLTMGFMGTGVLLVILACVLVYLSQRREARIRQRLLVRAEDYAEELAEVNNSLTRANDELKIFAYVASHDLQEPLRSISGYVQLLLRRYEAQLDEKAVGYIGKSVAATRRMQELIDGLLLYTRIGTRELSPEFVSLNEVLAEVMANLAASAEKSNAVVAVEELPEVLGDRVQLRQLFQNLISNAIKFRSEASPEIRVSAVPDGSSGPETVQVRVQDNGIGIDPQFADRVFKVFQRLHARQDYPGTGIGLAICKRIVERHGGELWLESEPGRGSSFIFTLTPYSEQALKEAS